jgi:dihydroorotate dehydrogenase
MYKSIIRPILFKYSPEKAHSIIFNLLSLSEKFGLKSIFSSLYNFKDKNLEKEVFGIKFPNPVGLAAGLDKDGDAFDMLGYLGFGFVEIGTVTPKAQSGNPKPRMYRLTDDSAIINRMGFNNLGVEEMVTKLRAKKSDIIIGGNIGKNKITSIENADDDYIKTFTALYNYVNYFVVNVSSPNTPNLRELQEKAPLTKLLTKLQKLNNQKGGNIPILLKIAPDLTNQQLDDIIDIVKTTKINGIVATNTTISRDNLSYDEKYIEELGNGGLSGKPLTQKSTEIIKYIVEKSNKTIPVIGVGGIMTVEDAIEKLEAGACLIQIYTGFIYNGPGFVKEINKEIIKRQL